MKTKTMGFYLFSRNKAVLSEYWTFPEDTPMEEIEKVFNEWREKQEPVFFSCQPI